MSTKRTKWHPPPPPTPRILNFPRRSRLFRPTKNRAKFPVAKKPNLEALMRQESRGCWGEERRAKVEESNSSPSGEITRDSAEDSWKFQADVLRAECNFLRMEREVALRKLDRNRVKMESVLTSLMETMISGRKKIDGWCGNAPMALDEEILAKLEEIHGGFRWTKGKVGRSGGNFDRRALSFRRRLETMEEVTSVKDIREISYQIAEPGISSKENMVALLASDPKCQFSDVEKLRMKMERLSKGMMERMEEHGLLSLSFESSASAPAAEAGRGNARHRLFDKKEVRAMAHRRRPLLQTEEVGSVKQLHLETLGVGRCCNCKNLVDKIAQQVMAEAEQCGEMQAMLDKVKTDMEELRSSRDHWEHRAISSELKFHSLHSQMLEWKRRALESEKTANELHKAEASSLPTLSDQLDSEICRLKQLKIREKQRKSSEFQSVKEKHVVVCQRRSPLQEIGNLPSKNSTPRRFR